MTNGTDKWTGWRFVAVWSALIAFSGLFWYGFYIGLSSIYMQIHG
jgi:hypothetical protein